MIIKSDLVNKTVGRLDIDSTAQAIVFTLTDGSFVRWDVDGDCCSGTWFHEIHGPEVMAGCVVQSVCEIEMPDVYLPDFEPQHEEVVKWYGVEVKTEKGTCRIVFRNESNGYYGGDVSECSSEKMPSGPWKQVTEDWEWS